MSWLDERDSFLENDVCRKLFWIIFAAVAFLSPAPLLLAALDVMPLASIPLEWLLSANLFSWTSLLLWTAVFRIVYERKVTKKSLGILGMYAIINAVHLAVLVATGMVRCL